MLIGAGLNIILDPLFIITFGWGVEGAAWATVISQFSASVWILSFNLGKKAVIHLRPGNFRPSVRTLLDIMVFGSSQCLLQLAIASVQFLLNWSMSAYGSGILGEGGGDVALSGLNIVMSVVMLFALPIFGINQGAQPIFGFNYGAKQYDRVRKTFLLAISGATVICLTGFTLALLFPHIIVRLFAPEGSPELLDFAPLAMRIVMITMPLNGLTIVSTNFFVVTGRPKTAIFLSMVRQVIALVPCLIIFGRIWGLWCVVFAMPVADGFTFLVVGIMILRELKKL